MKKWFRGWAIRACLLWMAWCFAFAVTINYDGLVYWLAYMPWVFMIGYILGGSK